MDSPAMAANSRETRAQITMCWRSVSRPPMALIQVHHKAGKIKGRVVDDGVHRDADDLGRHVVGHHGHHHHEEGHQEFSPEALGKGEKSQDG